MLEEMEEVLSSPEKTKKAVDILNERVNFTDITIEDYNTVDFFCHLKQ